MIDEYILAIYIVLVYKTRGILSNVIEIFLEG